LNRVQGELAQALDSVAPTVGGDSVVE
jgi:hypothetical protein